MAQLIQSCQPLALLKFLWCAVLVDGKPGAIFVPKDGQLLRSLACNEFSFICPKKNRKKDGQLYCIGCVNPYVQFGGLFQ